MNLRIAAVILAATLSVACGGPQVGIQHINIADNQTADGAQSTVNGNVTIGSAATVTGPVDTVNGRIELRKGAKTRSLSTVNGDLTIGDEAVVNGDLSGVNSTIAIGADVRIDGDVTTVNGSTTIGERTTVAGNVTFVNGTLTTDGTTIEGLVRFHNGEVRLLRSTVEENIIVDASEGSTSSKKPLVELGPGTQVNGRIIAHRPIELRIHRTARVKKGIEGAEPQYYEH